MIWDSSPWKRDIARRASELERRTLQKRWPEASRVLVDQTLFIAAYAVRKLLEPKKLSDEVSSLPLRAMTYAPRGRAVDLLNWHKPDTLYDMSATPGAVEFDLLAVCNQLIHSFVFVLDLAPSGVREACSSRRIVRNDLIAVLRRVAEDEVLCASYERDPSTGAMARAVGSSVPSGPRSRPV